MNYIKKITYITLIFLLSLSAYAKTQVSTQPHEGAITSIAIGTSAGKKVIYTGSDDGFLIRWTEDGQGEHFQISDDSIKMIAVHPNGNDIAVYETDGLTVNRLSVWNWQSLSKKFSSKRLDTAITSLDYTSRGSQIMVGQANIKGIIFIDSTKGTILSNKVKETAGTVVFSQTSTSENSSVMYSSLGYLIYTNLRNGTRKASFNIERNLQDPVIFNNDVLFAGVINNVIHIFDSTTGDSLASIKASNPIITTTKDDTNLYYFETSGKNATLKMIEVKDGELSQDSIIIKTFSFDSWDTPTSAIKDKNMIYIGMQSGELYSVNVNPETETVAALKITHKIFDKIYDINEFNGEFYFLSETSVFKSAYNTKNITSLAGNPGYTNMITSENTVYLWSKSTKKPVVKIDLSNGTQSTLFTPENPIEILKLQENKLLYIEGSNRVSFYNTENNEPTPIYTGTGIEDALIYKNDVFIAKAAATNPRSALIQVNINTKETIPININSEVVFSLTENQTSTGPFFGASIVEENGGNTTTKVFSYNPTTKAYSIVLSLADEDTDAFTYLKNGTLYTNIGKTQVYTVTIAQKKLVRMDQSSSLPVKVIGNNASLTVLNKDGSLTWYNAQSKNMLENWYITIDGEWSIQ